MECNKNKKKDNEKNAKHLQQEKKNVNLQNISFYFFFSLFLWKYLSFFFFHIYISIFSRWIIWEPPDDMAAILLYTRPTIETVRKFSLTYEQTKKSTPLQNQKTSSRKLISLLRKFRIVSSYMSMSVWQFICNVKFPNGCIGAVNAWINLTQKRRELTVTSYRSPWFNGMWNMNEIHSCEK